MTIEFQNEVKSDHVLFTGQGTYSNEAMYSVYESALDIVSREGLHAALIDVRAVTGNPPTTAARYEHGVTFAKLQSGQSPRILIVVVGTEPIVDPKRHIETVASNRGAWWRVFTDIDKATEWMSKEVKTLGTD